MESADVISSAFWKDSTPVAAGGFGVEIPAIPGLRNHVLFETSGSSAAPKWIALSKQALLASAAAVNRHLDVTHTACWGLALPLRHVGGFGVAARAHAAGCRFSHFSARWNPEAFSSWLDDVQVTHTSLVPTQVHDLIKANLRAPSCLQAIVVGGGRLDEATGRTARALGWPVLASYGMTEAASQIATQPLQSLHAIYQPAPIPLLPVWRAEIGSDMRLKIAGPALFSGTVVNGRDGWDFIPRDGEWHVTGDRVEIDDNLLTPLGRADSLVKVLGELVDPEEIERRLVNLSDGRIMPGSVIVVPVPDERAGHALVPVFDPSVDRDAIAAVLHAYAATASGPWRLREPVFPNEFPRSPLGKPLRAKIANIVHGDACA